MSAPATGPRPPRSEPSLGKVVLEDLRRTEFRRTVLQDLKDLYGFYLDEEARARLAGMGRVRRAFSMLGWLLKSLLMKLSPVRRLLLLVALVLGLVGEQTFTSGDVSIGVNLRGWGFLVLLVILMLELKDKLVARDEIEVARGVQMALLPREHPGIAGWSVWSITLPANDVGGDLVDYIDLGEGRLGAALGDVAGKGLGAALLMAKLQATLRAIVPDHSTLEGLGARLNTILHRDGLDNRFATLVYLRIEPGSGRVRYLNAGHNPPCLVRRGSVECRIASSMPLGMLPTGNFVEESLEMQKGDLLVVYSDGLTEAWNEREEFFGLDRLRALLPSLLELSPERAGEKVLEAFRDFVGSERPHDDLSLLLLRRG